jgi:hypothetical protein
MEIDIFFGVVISQVEFVNWGGPVLAITFNFASTLPTIRQNSELIWWTLVPFNGGCRFTFKMRFFIFHGATKSDRCGWAFALNLQVIVKSRYRLAEHCEVCGSLSVFSFHDETKQTFESPWWDYVAAPHLQNGWPKCLWECYFRHSRQTPKEKVSSWSAKSLILKAKRHEYNISRIGFNEWQALASACGIDSEMLMNRVRQLADALPDAISAARDQALADGLNREVVTTLTDLLILHAGARRATLNAAASRRRRSRKIVAENWISLHEKCFVDFGSENTYPAINTGIAWARVVLFMQPEQPRRNVSVFRISYLTLISLVVCSQ